MPDTSELTLTRSFDAPLELVWAALTQAEHLAHWWGPAGFTWLGCTLDLRPGGTFQYGMSAPNNGPEMWGKFVYEEIEAPTRLVFRNSFADREGNIIRAFFSPDWPLEVHNTWTLDQHEGKTRLTLRGHPFNATEAERNAFEGMLGSMQQGFNGTFDQLAAFLARA
jgi:uncharacterized protein YndB with AHSA1/START domain